MTIIKPLTQLREMISKSLSGQTNLSKSFNPSSSRPWNLCLHIQDD